MFHLKEKTHRQPLSNIQHLVETSHSHTFMCHFIRKHSNEQINSDHKNTSREKRQKKQNKNKQTLQLADVVEHKFLLCVVYQSGKPNLN